MGKETTPIVISDEIKAFCTSITPNSSAEYIKVCPDYNCIPDECFVNVKRKVETFGGNMQLGWMLWIRPNILINATCHAIWVADAVDKVDITPKEEDKILFLPDDSISYTGYRIGSKYKALTSSPLVDELIKLLEARDHILSKHLISYKEISFPFELIKRINEINIILNQKAGRNEPCPCQSGLKYKRCCGKQE